MSGNNSHIISQNNVKSEPSVSTCLPDRKTSSLGHSGPSVPTKLAYVDFRPWFKGWDQLDVSDQDKLKDLVIFNSTHQIDQYPNI
uniref:Ovule protein n=1 Tax=Schistosoma mansoni TaxID=6183 RepID=A0A5K4F268_SCHMA